MKRKHNSVKSGRRYSKTSTRNRAKDWAESWRNWRIGKDVRLIDKV